MWPFSDFRYGFRSSQSTTAVLTVVSYRIARVFNRSRATLSVTLFASKAFNKVWRADIFQNVSLMEFQVR